MNDEGHDGDKGGVGGVGWGAYDVGLDSMCFEGDVTGTHAIA